LKPEKGVTLIEWANIIGEIFDEDTISLKFSRMKENSSSRKIEIKGIKLDV